MEGGILCRPLGMEGEEMKCAVVLGYCRHQHKIRRTIQVKSPNTDNFLVLQFVMTGSKR